MRIFEKILCPIDFSESSIKALQWSQYLARRFESKLVVLHVMDFYPSPAEVGIDFEKYQASITTALREFAEPLTVPHEEMLSTGDASQKITALASGLSASVIVMGTRGITGTIHRLIGSTAERVVRSASVPVLTISPNCPAPGLTEATNRILVPMSSLHRLPRGYIKMRKLLRDLRMDPTFLYVVDFKDAMFDASFDANPFLVTTYQTVEKKEELVRLGNIIAKNGNCDAEVQFGDVSDEILKTLETRQFDFVLIGGRKKNFMARFIESNTYKVISQAPVPSITVKVE